MKVLKTIAEDMRIISDLLYEITKIRTLIGRLACFCMRVCNHGCDVNCLEFSQPLSCFYQAMQLSIAN